MDAHNDPNRRDSLSNLAKLLCILFSFDFNGLLKVSQRISIGERLFSPWCRDHRAGGSLAGSDLVYGDGPPALADVVKRNEPDDDLQKGRPTRTRATSGWL